MSPAAGQRRTTSPVRLTLASELGHDIDGAWWLRTGSMERELRELVAALGTMLGGVIDIRVNWSSGGPPNLGFYGWESKHPPVMTIIGLNAQANLLIVPYQTSRALAVMVLRQAADLQIDPTQRDTDTFRAADCIVRAARSQRAARRDPGDSLG